MEFGKGDLVTCVKCGWVYGSCSLEYAEQAVREFNEYYYKCDKETQERYIGPATISLYEGCWCGSKKFRPFKEGDCPNGVTIGLVICEENSDAEGQGSPQSDPIRE